MCPTDSFEIAQCDQIVDALSDLFAKMLKFVFEKDPEKQVGYFVLLFLHLWLFCRPISSLIRALMIVDSLLCLRIKFFKALILVRAVTPDWHESQIPHALFSVIGIAFLVPDPP